MLENSRTAKYDNGSPIPIISNVTARISLLKYPGLNVNNIPYSLLY